MKNNNVKEKLIGLSALFIYFFVSAFQTVPLQLLNIEVSELSTSIKIIYSLGCELFILFSILFLFRKKLKKDFIDIKENHKVYFKDCFKYYLFGLAIMMISNLILAFLTGGIAGNEESVREILGNHPIYMWISAVLIAPFLEELLFRQSIRNFFHNKWIFILFSGFIFGGLHVIGNIEVIYDFFYIIPYSSLGIAFAYMLYKYNNIFVSIGFHLMHNGIILSLQILLLLFS